MGEPVEYTDPLVEFRDDDENGHWVDHELYLTSEWEMKVILTPRVKPFPEGTIVKMVNHEVIFYKLEGLWYTCDLLRPDLAWQYSHITDQYIKEHSEIYAVLYEPEAG